MGNPASKKMVSCLGLVDPISRQTWIFDATPDFKEQMTILSNELDQTSFKLPSGVFLTHGHMGHYTGLSDLGREAMGSKNVKVYAMPRMTSYLRNNGPWSQLVALKNIELAPLEERIPVRINERIKVTPILVPHRDEFTETVGFQIEGPEKSVLFIPDIDKWEKWEASILKQIDKNDVLFLDGTFYKNGEIPGRDMAQIPHPFIEESMEKFKHLPPELKEKVYFIHFNHTNPVIKKNSPERKLIEGKGYHLAEEYLRVTL